MNFSFFRTNHNPKCGFTLVELLVVIAVISLLTGISLPAIKNSLREQRVVRSASLVQAAIEEARARAIATGGGGVIIDRVGVDSLNERCESIRLRMADEPPSYSGDSPDAKAIYLYEPDTTNAATRLNPYLDTHYLLFDNDQFQMIRSADDIDNLAVPTLINIGDVIRLGDAKLPVQILNIVNLGDLTTPPAWSNWTSTLAPVPQPTGYPNDFVRVQVVPVEDNVDLRRFDRTLLSFDIRRSPRPSIAMPIELPSGTSIDLTSSGLGRFGNEFSPMGIEGNYITQTNRPFTPNPLDYRSIWILFGPRGEVSRILRGQYETASASIVLQQVPVTGDVHLLVGRRGEVKTLPTEQLEDDDPNPLGDEAKDGTTPLLDAESIWVTIHARNGEVTATPWINPTNGVSLIPASGAATNAAQQARIQTVIGRTRSAAVSALDIGSL
ncbi:putative major pilin subunit [Planctomycetes bacterium CA13]|uniref:Putative major pilin subunit n=1 Tax=Novipirellula herctigrandis TaxID=2527986 RepID=A0A5C5Z476_9BACT|nr:putative major pilin subunit [Planctomycetes bacterium CA13]